MPDLSIQHGLYREQLEGWLEAQDFYRSGRHVLEPGRIVTYRGFLVGPRLTDGSAGTELDAKRTRIASRFERFGLQSYIWAHANETPDDYSERSARAVHVPLLRHMIDTFVSAALRIKPDRSGAPDGEPWASYLRNADLRGTSLDALGRQIMAYSLVYGMMHSITDRPAFDVPASNRADQLARGERAYTYLVSPIDVINWRTDDLGALMWVVIREDAPDIRAPGDEQPEQVPQYYRVWYRDHWELFRESSEDTGDFVRVAEGVHGAGRVPLTTCFARRSEDVRRPMMADSMLAGLVRADRKLFNALSVLDEVLAKQGFSRDYLPVDDGGQPAPIAMGPGRYVGYNSANGQPLILSPDASLIMAHWQSINSLLQLIKETEGVGRGKAEYSKEERSAEALQVESRNEHNRVVSLIEAIEDWENDTLEIVGAIEGATPPRASYNREVSLRGLTRQLQDALSMKSLGLPFETLKAIIRPLVVQYMQELGQQPESIAAAVQAVDAMQEEDIPDGQEQKQEGQEVARVDAAEGQDAA